MVLPRAVLPGIGQLGGYDLHQTVRFLAELGGHSRPGADDVLRIGATSSKFQQSRSIT